MRGSSSHLRSSLPTLHSQSHVFRDRARDEKRTRIVGAQQLQVESVIAGRLWRAGEEAVAVERQAGGELAAGKAPIDGAGVGGFKHDARGVAGGRAGKRRGVGADRYDIGFVGGVEFDAVVSFRHIAVRFEPELERVAVASEPTAEESGTFISAQEISMGCGRTMRRPRALRAMGPRGRGGGRARGRRSCRRRRSLRIAPYP